MALERQRAWELLCRYNEEHCHLQHGITVERVTGYFAQVAMHRVEKENNRLMAEV